MKNISILLLLITVSATSLYTMEYQHSVNTQNKHNPYELHNAIWQGDTQRAKELLEDNKPIKLRDISNSGFLHTQANQNNLPIFHKLLSKLCMFIDINRQDLDGNTPLHIAAYRNREEIVSPLLNHTKTLRIGNRDLSNIIDVSITANINLQNKYGNTPLHIAVQCGHLNIVRLLLENGAHPTLNLYHDLPSGIIMNQDHHNVTNFNTDIWQDMFNLL